MSQQNKIILWIVVVGTALLVAICGPFYFSMRTSSPITPNPLQDVRTENVGIKHYANEFYEFDYPDDFILDDRSRVTATHTIRKNYNENIDSFGFSEIFFKHSSSNGDYRVSVGSSVDKLHIQSPKEFFKNAPNALDEYISPKDPAVLKDEEASYKEIQVDGHRAGRFFRLFNNDENYPSGDMVLWVVIPTEKMVYQLEVSGLQFNPLVPGTTLESNNFKEAENFMTVFTNSFKIKEISTEDYNQVMNTK